MNTKKLAEALRKAGDMSYALVQGDLNAVRRVLTNVQIALDAAAAACEEEGKEEALARKDVWDTLVRHCERIEALEGSVGRLERIEGSDALVKRITALEVNKDYRIASMVERIASMVERIAALEAQAYAEGWKARENQPAPPPAPEERCARCDHVRADHNTNNCCFNRATYVPAPSPEQAQETMDSPNFVPPEVAELAARLFERINRHAPPGQARRTYTRADDGVKLVELRPGERIVSGEGVRMHRFGENTTAFPCDKYGDCGRPYLIHGVFYPDAPPRAEEK